MRRLVSLSLLITFVLSLFGGIAVAVGHQQPPSDKLRTLHFDMCKPPCWIGITPGTTTIAEAKRRVARLFSANPNLLATGFTKAGGMWISIYSDADFVLGRNRGVNLINDATQNINGDTVIQEMVFYDDFSLLDLLSLEGIPTRVSVVFDIHESCDLNPPEPVYPKLFLEYPRGVTSLVTLESSGNSITPDDWPDQTEFFIPTFGPSNAPPMQTTHWLGFGPFQRYCNQLLP
jgi:hypothetical protein